MQVYQRGLRTDNWGRRYGDSVLPHAGDARPHSVLHWSEYGLVVNAQKVNYAATQRLVAQVLIERHVLYFVRLVVHRECV